MIFFEKEEAEKYLAEHGLEKVCVKNRYFFTCFWPDSPEYYVRKIPSCRAYYIYARFFYKDLSVWKCKVISFLDLPATKLLEFIENRGFKNER